MPNQPETDWRKQLWKLGIEGVRLGLEGTRSPHPLPETLDFVPLDEAQRQASRMQRIVNRHLAKRLPELAMLHIGDRPSVQDMERALQIALQTAAHELCGPGGILEQAGPDEQGAEH